MMDKKECKRILRGKEKSPIPDSDSWRLAYLETLLTERLQAYYGGNEENYQRLSSLINLLVTN